jgi:hypothetical protein
VIVWATREPGPAEAHVWLPGGSPTIVPATTTAVPASATGLAFDYHQHEARLTSLSPAMAYSYDVFVGGEDATSGTDQLSTAPPTGSGRVTFIAFGDSGTGSTAQRQLAQQMSADAFDLAIVAGDLVYGFSNGTGDASYLTYHDWFFSIYQDWLRARPVFPALGNHDSRSSTDDGRAYLDLFVLPENGGSAAYPDHAERYYSFDYGPIHFVALDTELAFQDAARRAEQLSWL